VSGHDAAPLPQSQADERGRALALYWGELVQLKVACEYTQRYRDHLEMRLTQARIGRAVVSVGALGSWVGGLGYPKLWGFVIVVSQVAEAIQAVLPYNARLRGLRAAVVAFDAALIDALFEWEEMQTENPDVREINRRWYKLMRLKHEIEIQHLTAVGLPEKPHIFRVAERAAADYFEVTYGTRRIL
jgi:hypothetical protein